MDVLNFNPTKTHCIIGKMILSGDDAYCYVKIFYNFFILL